MLKCTDRLVIALSNDILHIAHVLLARGFISEDTHAEMHIETYTPQKKASIVVTAIRNKIKVDSHQFQELMQIYFQKKRQPQILSRYFSLSIIVGTS